MAVLDLRGDQVAQGIARLLLGAERHQRTGGLDQIARPYEVVAPAFVAAIAPRNAEARHHRSRISLVEMAAQDDGRNEKFFGERRRNVERNCVAFAAFGMPRLPRCDVLLQQTIERLQQTTDGQRRRRFGAAPKSEREHYAAGKLGDQSNVPRSGIFVFPSHRAIAGKILPAVAVTDIAGAGPADSIALPFVNRSQCGAERPLLGPQSPATAIQNDGSAVAVASGAEMRRKQEVRPQLRITIEPTFDRQHIATDGRGDAQAQRIAFVLVHDFDCWHARRQQADPVIGDALDLGPEAFAIRDDKTEVADLRNVDPGIIDFVDDAETESEPQPGNAERAPNHVLGAAGPGRHNPRSAGSIFDHRNRNLAGFRSSLAQPRRSFEQRS
jgi:hypothetical protein